MPVGDDSAARRALALDGRARVAAREHPLGVGRPLEELKESITLDRYKGWANYERLRRMNVEAAYLNLIATP